MQDIIQLLPDSVANQIAAGEVVQRPASIVKELLENAIDAQATQIKMVVKDAGKTLLQVIDNGVGMSETDARMSFERHATSKIRKAEDLFTLYTMGFRGEALASIAAVAQVEMKTRRKLDEMGTLLQIEASAIKNQEPVNCSIGTSISVKNLFFNIPARKNFLKTDAVEMKHILDDFIKMALANASVGFNLVHQETEIFNLQSGKLYQRIVGIFGNNYKQQLASCQEQTTLLNIQGYVGKPEFAKKTRGEQFFFVNKRFIRHPYLHNAVMQAYQKLIPADSFPFYVLFLEIDPQHIDINIHPTKTEIKFDDERTVYAIVQAAVKNTLATYNLMPSIDFETDVNFSLGMPTNFPPLINNKQPLKDKNTASHFKPEPNYTQRNNLQNWNKLYEHLQKNAPEETQEQTPLIFESKANQPNFIETVGKNWNFEEKDLLQIHHQLIVTQTNSGMLIINQQYATERILYDKLIENLKKQQNMAQQLLFPVNIHFSAPDFNLILDIQTEMRNLGFEFEFKPEHTIFLTGIPSENTEDNEKELFEAMIEQYKMQESLEETNTAMRLAQALAKRTAIKSVKKLTKLEMNYLIDKLFASSNPNYTPDGKVTCVVLNLQQVMDMFGQKK